MKLPADIRPRSSATSQGSCGSIEEVKFHLLLAGAGVATILLFLRDWGRPGDRDARDSHPIILTFCSWP